MVISNQIYSSAPDFENRLSTEIDTFNFLQKLNISFERIEHEPANTISQCEEIEKKLNAEICKNLFLTNSDKSKYYLLLLPGSKSFKTKDVSKQINSTRLSFGTPEKMYEYLRVTPGSVSIMGLMYDINKSITLLVDSSVLQNDFFCFHPCINTGTIKVRTQDIFDKLIPEFGYTPIFINI